ncbi:MAG: GNAT family N-acetyltransferase [Candidatus Thorarchaeota archaeon]
MSIRKLVGERCYLAPISSLSVEAYAKWDNDLEVAIPLGDEAYLSTTVESLRNDLQGVFSKKSHIYDIVTLEDDLIIGRCMFFNINPTDRTAYIGIVIGEKDYWNKGYGAEALQLLLEYGFNLLNFHNVTLGVFSYNKRAIRCYEKVGFKTIGRKREVRIIGERKYDLIYMDMLAHELEVKYLKSLLDELDSE